MTSLSELSLSGSSELSLSDSSELSLIQISSVTVNGGAFSSSDSLLTCILRFVCANSIVTVSGKDDSGSTDPSVTGLTGIYCEVCHEV